MASLYDLNLIYVCIFFRFQTCSRVIRTFRMHVTVKMDKTIDKFIRKRGLLGQAGGYEAPAVYGSPQFDRGKYRQDRIVRRDIALANGVSLRYPGFFTPYIRTNRDEGGSLFRFFHPHDGGDDDGQEEDFFF